MEWVLEMYAFWSSSVHAFWAFGIQAFWALSWIEDISLFKPHFNYANIPSCKNSYSKLSSMIFIFLDIHHIQFYAFQRLRTDLKYPRILSNCIFSYFVSFQQSWMQIFIKAVHLMQIRQTLLANGEFFFEVTKQKLVHKAIKLQSHNCTRLLWIAFEN